MAKKKNKKGLGKFMLFATAVFTILTIVMAFLPNVKVSEDSTLTGFKVMFGWDVDIPIIGNTEVASFSFLAFFAYLLPILGVILAVLFRKSKLFSVIPILCFIASAVLLFLIPDFVVYNNEYVGKYASGELAYGAIVAGVSSALSAVAICAKVFLD